MSMSYGFPRLSATEVLKTYTAATKPDQYSLGDVYICRHHGLRQFVRLMKAADSLILGNVCTAPNIAQFQFQSSANVYTTAVDDGTPATLLMDEDEVSAAVAKDELAGLTLALTENTGIGQFAQIIGNTVASTLQKTTLKLSRNFVTAPVAGTDVQVIPDLIAKKCSALTDPFTGVAQGAVTAGDYFWAVVGGWAGVLIQTDTTTRDTNAEILQVICGATAGTAEVVHASAPNADIYPEAIPFGECWFKVAAGATLAICYIWPRRLI